MKTLTRWAVGAVMLVLVSWFVADKFSFIYQKHDFSRQSFVLDSKLHLDLTLSPGTKTRAYRGLHSVDTTGNPYTAFLRITPIDEAGGIPMTIRMRLVDAITSQVTNVSLPDEGARVSLGGAEFDKSGARVYMSKPFDLPHQEHDQDVQLVVSVHTPSGGSSDVQADVHAKAILVTWDVNVFNLWWQSIQGV